MHGNASTVLATYEPAELKKKLAVVNSDLHKYKNQEEYSNRRIFDKVKNNPNLEMIRRFEEHYRVQIVGIAECGKSLHLRLYDPIKDQVLTDGVKIRGSQTSTTVQSLGISIADVVMERARQPQYKTHISDEVINIAARTKKTLGRKGA